MAKRSYRKKSKQSKRSKRSKKSKGGYTRQVTRLLLKEKNKKSRLAAYLTGTASLTCPRGKIKRDAYITDNGRIVGATCIENRGKPGKSKRTILPRKRLLSRYGYKDIDDLTKKERMNALKESVISEGYEDTIKRLTALHNLHIRTNPKLAKKVKADQEEISKMYKKVKKKMNM